MESQQNLLQEKPVSKLEKASFIIFLITLILTPLIFIPSTYSWLEMMKTVVIAFGILISSVLYFISALKMRSFYIPKHPLILCGLLVSVSLIISSLFSTNIWKSFFGQGFELGTASFFLILFLGSLLSIYLTSRNKDRILYAYGAIILPFLLLALYHVVRFMAGPDFMDFGIFQTLNSTMLGKWNDLAIYSGIVAILSYCGLRFIVLNKLFKILLSVLLVISGFFLFITNSPIVWSCLALAMFAMAVYEYSATVREGKWFVRIWKGLPIFTVIILIISILLAWKGDNIARPVVVKMKAENTEISLPWQLSVDIIGGTVKEHPLFGSGPNRFLQQYLKNKPAVVNPTQFWNLEFGNAFGLIPTFFVTQGLVGGVLWIIFIVIFAISGARALKKVSDPFSLFFIASSFFSALFLWIVSLVYVPSHSIIFLIFILTGLFLASFATERYGDINKKIAIVPLIIIIAVCVVWLFVYTNKTVALGYFQSGINSLNLPNNQGLDEAKKDFEEALSWSKNDIYYQALSETNILKIRSLVQTSQVQAGKAPDAEVVSSISSLIDEAIGYTRSAIAIDPANYYNYVAEARISEVALSLGVPSAYENIKTAYGNAIAYNPYNPSLYLSLARVEASQNKLTEAQGFIGQALQLKQNYTEAIFLLSQIQVTQGKIKDAITSVEVATGINPTNPLLFFQLGLLHYNDKNYTKAVDVLNQAIRLDNSYANARYFLGLSYARLGKTADAIIQFENLAETNPDNAEVALILSNLKSGKSAFADATPPIDNKPEARKTLPIK